MLINTQTYKCMNDRETDGHSPKTSISFSNGVNSLGGSLRALEDPSVVVPTYTLTATKLSGKYEHHFVWFCTYSIAITATCNAEAKQRRAFGSIRFADAPSTVLSTSHVLAFLPALTSGLYIKRTLKRPHILKLN